MFDPVAIATRVADRLKEEDPTLTKLQLARICVLTEAEARKAYREECRDRKTFFGAKPIDEAKPEKISQPRDFYHNMDCPRPPGN